MDKDRNSSLGTFTELTIFFFLLTIFSPHKAPQNSMCCEIFIISLKNQTMSLIWATSENIYSNSFEGTINPLCNCDQDIESSTHFFLHCRFFINSRRTLLSNIRSLDSTLLDCTDYDLTQTLLFGNTSQVSSNNFKIINAIDWLYLVE